MKAVVIDKPGSVHVKEFPDPKPGPLEVVVRPRACGFCGTDVHIFKGDFIGRYPVIPCHEFSGEVVQVGVDVHTIQIGDLVSVDPNIRCGHCPPCRNGKQNLCEAYEAIGVTRPGGFSERVCIPAPNGHTFKGTPYSTLAFAEPLACVLYGQSRLVVKPGQSILVWGAGSIGLLHAQIFERLHGCRVTVVDVNPKRLDLAERIGVSYGIEKNRRVDAHLNQMQSSGWDIVVEATGSVDALRQAIPHVRRGGQICIFGVYPKKEWLSISPFEIFYKDLTLFGTLTYRHEFAAAVQLLSEQRIETEGLVDVKIPLDEVPSMFQRIRKGYKPGKIQVHM